MLRPTRKERGEKAGAGVPPMFLCHPFTSANSATAFVVLEQAWQVTLGSAPTVKDERRNSRR